MATYIQYMLSQCHACMHALALLQDMSIRLNWSLIETSKFGIAAKLMELL